jgi:hypothetical protein
MDPSEVPVNPTATAALVVRAVQDIDARSEGQSDILLSHLLCAAWGSVRAQNQ